MTVRACLFGFCLSLIPLTASAAPGQDGGIAAGAASFNALSPVPEMKISDGAFFAIQAEKSISTLPLSVTAGINYYKTTGALNYNYVSPTTTYMATNATFSLD